MTQTHYFPSPVPTQQAAIAMETSRCKKGEENGRF